MPPMRYLPSRRLVRRLLTIGFVLALSLGIWLNWAWAQSQWQTLRPTSKAQAGTVRDPGPRVELVPDQPDTVRIPKELLATPRVEDGLKLSPPPELADVPSTCFEHRPHLAQPPVGQYVSVVARQRGPRVLEALSLKFNDGFTWKRPLNYAISVFTVIGYLWLVRRRFPPATALRRSARSLEGE